jgi:hypothetical protein
MAIQSYNLQATRQTAWFTALAFAAISGIMPQSALTQSVHSAVVGEESPVLPTRRGAPTQQTAPSVRAANSAIDLLPADRCIDWSMAGIPGGIPSRTVIYRILDVTLYGDGTADATSAIQSAIDSCPDNQVVFLPAGKYKTSQTIHLYDRKTLRGAGPGKTILSFDNTWGRSVLDMRGLFNWDVTGRQRSFAITGGAAKGSTQITLASTGTISIGDILLIDQLNDPQLVDPVGYEGLCNYCGRLNGTRARGQIVEVTALNGNVVSLNLPLYYTLSASLVPQATLVDAGSMVRWAGVEDLTVTESQAVVDYLIEMDGAQYCWLRNIEVERVNQRAVWLIESLQNEIRESYFHNAINGFGRSYGYGILTDIYSSANLIEDNILRTLDGGFLMAAGGASGNVFAYNYMVDSRFDDPWWLTASPSISHAPHPSMNLWEGNVGIQAAADCIHGSSSHNTLFRCRFSGWQDVTITSNNNAIELQYKNTFMNVVGCILGMFGHSDTYETAYPASGDNILKNIWRLGYGGPSWAGDTTVKATLLRHQNYDYVTKKTDIDSRITATNLPPSLYLSSKPAWWGNTPWPPIGPDVSDMVNKIPAQLRYEASLNTGVPENPVFPTAGRQPAEFQLLQNYPNPFNPVTTIRFGLPHKVHVTLTVFNTLGQQVALLVEGALEAGEHEVHFDGGGLPSGVYLYRLRAGEFVQTRRLLLLR